MKLFLYINTLLSLRVGQIFARLTFGIKRKYLLSFINRRVSKMRLPRVPGRYGLQKKCFGKYARQDLAARKFDFLHITAHFQDNILWNDSRKPKLWRYNLHYFEYLLPLAAQVEAANFTLGRRLIYDWIEHNPIGAGDGWEPYPISLRAVNWMFYYDAYFDFFQQDQTFKEVFLTSLYRQVGYLTYFLEKHLLANHLWANAKTLLFAGLFFNESKWIAAGLKLVQGELKEQMLSDGGHYERSPMYHAIVLLDVIDLLNVMTALNGAVHVLPAGLSAVKTDLTARAKAMWRWLVGLTQPDGALPLLGDTALGVVPSTEEIGRYLHAVLGGQSALHVPEGNLSFPQSGYFVYRDAQRYLVLDGGELGVGYQPGHAHCDFLSFELSYKGLRFIVDSGPGEYVPSALRLKARSIRSHNTLVINGLDQAELWSAFRMGRRIKPERVHCEVAPLFVFQASYHNRLNKRKAYWHQRTVRIDNGGMDVSDRFKAERLLSLENLLHLHPACRIQLEVGRVIVQREATGIAIEFDPERTEVRVDEWFYVPEFGRVQTASLVVLRPKQMAVSEMRYRIVWQ